MATRRNINCPLELTKAVNPVKIPHQTYPSQVRSPTRHAQFAGGRVHTITPPTHLDTPNRFPSAAPSGWSTTNTAKNAATASFRSLSCSPACLVNPAVSAFPILVRSREFNRNSSDRNGRRYRSVRRRIRRVR